MADEHENPEWGHQVARWTFIVTIVLAVLYVGVVVVFVLSR